MKKIGECIRAMRQVRGWSQETLGREAGGLRQCRISGIENGKPFYVHELLAIVRALRCDVAELLEAVLGRGTIHLVVTPPQTRPGPVA